LVSIYVLHGLNVPLTDDISLLIDCCMDWIGIYHGTL